MLTNALLFLQDSSPMWQPALEVMILWFAFYVLLVYIKDSGMLQALRGVFFLILLFVLANTLKLGTIRWILSHVFQISIIGFLIIFQSELRRGLSRIGQSPLFKLFVKEERLVDEIAKAVVHMAKNRVGALIAIEREMGLKPYVETGIALDGVVSSELITTIFMPNTPFHDGGIVIEGSRIIAVSCLFPLSQSQKLAKTLGTRHRAGLGLSEETDALVIVVSEETGVVSIMNQGKLQRDIDDETLRKELALIYEPQPKKNKRKRMLFGRRSS